jgi:hypothetical protein
MSAATTAILEKPSAWSGELSMKAKVFAFATMSVGFFIALLDIQIVSASLGEIGAGLSAGPDEIAWVQTSYLSPRSLSFRCQGGCRGSSRHAGCSPSRLPDLPRPACCAAGPGTSRV